jgi:CheY-like chemotaxis protein
LLVEVQERPAPDARRARNVLVVDDEPDILESLQAYLEATLPGVRVYTAGRADEALPMLRELDIQVVVSDLRMPGMDGLAFLTQVRKRFPTVRRILITAFSEEDLDERAQEVGVGTVLRKPFELESFRETIAEALS